MDLVKAVVEASRVIHIDGGSCNCFRKLLACLTRDYADNLVGLSSVLASKSRNCSIKLHSASVALSPGTGVAGKRGFVSHRRRIAESPESLLLGQQSGSERFQRRSTELLQKAKAATLDLRFCRGFDIVIA